MKAATSLILKRVVQGRAEAAGLLREAGEAVLIERGRPRWLLLSCPCGCGDEIPINLDQQAGKAWRLYRDRRHGVSLYPSVWRDTNCGSHFIVWRSKILLFRSHEDEAQWLDPREEMDKLCEAVLEKLPTSGYVPYAALADSIGEIPWDVLDACRVLVRSGLAREGTDKMRGSFARR